MLKYYSIAKYFGSAKLMDTYQYIFNKLTGEETVVLNVTIYKLSFPKYVFYNFSYIKSKSKKIIA